MYHPTLSITSSQVVYFATSTVGTGKTTDRLIRLPVERDALGEQSRDLRTHVFINTCHQRLLRENWVGGNHAGYPRSDTMQLIPKPAEFLGK